MEHKRPEHGPSAFLLAQVGAHAAAKFAERLTELDLTPADAGVLRILRGDSGISQQELAGRLQIHPTRLVALLDKLGDKKLVERKQNATDRRLYSLHLTREGETMLEKVGQVARTHQQAITADLSREENETLASLLWRVAVSQGLTAGVHPGYRTLQDRRVGEGSSASPSHPSSANAQAAARPTKKARSRSL